MWFHSLDITRLIPVLVARATYRLPYVWAKMAIEAGSKRVEYRARRRWPGPRGARSTVAVEIGEQIEEPSDFEHYLTARWGLYTMLGKRLTHARVEHEPWPLHRATIVEVSDDFMKAAGYTAPSVEPHVLYSPGVSVRIERPRFVGSGC